MSKVDIVCIIDKSGSMQPLTGDTIGSYNAFLEEQKEIKGEAWLTTVLFSHNRRVLNRRLPLSDAPKLDTNIYRADGVTALLDAIGETTNEVLADQKKLKKKHRPDKTIVLIITDGHENASSEFSRQQIFDLIKEREEKGWKFVYLGANVDAFAEAGSMGFAAASTFSYAATSEGVRGAYSLTASLVTDFREDYEDSGSG